MRNTLHLFTRLTDVVFTIWKCMHIQQPRNLKLWLHNQFFWLQISFRAEYRMLNRLYTYSCKIQISWNNIVCVWARAKWDQTRWDKIEICKSIYTKNQRKISSQSTSASTTTINTVCAINSGRTFYLHLSLYLSCLSSLFVCICIYTKRKS